MTGEEEESCEMILYGRCQLQNLLARHDLRQRVRIWRARIAPRSTLRRLLAARKAAPPRLGEPSRFPEGSWVRIREAPDVRRTLDAGDRLRGLEFVEQMWSFCGTTHRVMKSVRRMLDDQGHLRPVSGTALLGTPCGGAAHDDSVGCGRECPLMYRDEWLEAVPAPPDSDHPTENEPGGGLHATVKSRTEIEHTLDRRGRHRGLLFMPEMGTYEGSRFRVRKKIERVWEGFRETTAAEPIYILEGLNCSGAALGTAGPCHRGCRLLWHQAWLDLDRDGPPG